MAAALRSHLAEGLPEYMVPSAYVGLEGLPLTPNGKLDRKALPAPDDEAVVRREYEAPRGEVEEALAAVWRELLKLERVGRQDNFFELGGHSLLAVRLQSRVLERLKVQLPLVSLFGEPALAAQAQAIERMLAEAGEKELPGIQRVSREGPLALSFAQQRLWFLAQLGESVNYHMRFGVRLKGELDKEALRRSLDAMVERHESLRSVFVGAGESPHVELKPPGSGMAWVEESLEESKDAQKELEELCREEGRAPFDLGQGPLIRGRLVRMGPGEHVFLLTQHHIVTDGWSTGVFFRELSQLYEAFVRAGKVR